MWTHFRRCLGRSCQCKGGINDAEIFRVNSCLVLHLQPWHGGCDATPDYEPGHTAAIYRPLKELRRVCRANGSNYELHRKPDSRVQKVHFCTRHGLYRAQRMSEEHQHLDVGVQKCTFCTPRDFLVDVRHLRIAAKPRARMLNLLTKTHDYTAPRQHEKYHLACALKNRDGLYF